jgi:hypothetical protein
VPDVDADSFQEMLTYIYKGAVPLDRMSMDQMLGLHNAGFYFNSRRIEAKIPN